MSRTVAFGRDILGAPDVDIEVRIKEEQKKKAEEEENRRQLAERKEKIEEFWVELLPKNLEEGHLLMTEKESEEGWTRQEIFFLKQNSSL